MGFNPYAAGSKVYGFGRPNPTSGVPDITGYRERDMKMAALKRRRNALLRRMKAKQKGRYMSSDYLKGSS